MLLVSLLAACGTDDPRNPSFEVIASEILAPTCGQVQCHSTTTYVKKYAFDTLDAARVTLRQMPKSGRESLIGSIRATGGSRMPPDSPLDDADIALIQRWVDMNEPGL